MDTASRQIIAFYVGDRSCASAQQLWQRIPPVYQQHATFATDDWDAYKGVMPEAPHEVCAKGTGRTNAIEHKPCHSQSAREQYSFQTRRFESRRSSSSSH